MILLGNMNIASGAFEKVNARGHCTVPVDPKD